jgi:NTP pyrophosphatase (non-canonical NTP hydrolase)
VELNEFQERIRKLYIERDERRGLFETYAWLVEEVGELSRALRRRDRENLKREFADVVAWLVSVANLVDIDVAECCDALYGKDACPRCNTSPCTCAPR